MLQVQSGHQHYFEFEDEKQEKSRKYDDGSVYRGEMMDTFRHGQGEMRYFDGSVYSGSFKNDKKEGFGIYQYKDGDKYEGQFMNNRRHGFGNYYYNDNLCIYHGYYYNNKKQGHGMIKLDDDVVITGVFTDGELNEGNISFPNGSKYFGGIENYLMSGNGYLKYSDGFIVKGIFENDNLLLDERLVCCFCCEDDCDGECYEYFEGICGKTEIFSEENN